VGILREQERVAVMSNRPIDVRGPGRPAVVLPPGAYEMRPGPSGVELPNLGEFVGSVRVAPTEEARIFVGIRPYRGIIEVRRTPSGRLTVINELPLEAYLYGVLKMEVDPAWPPEALKAQAVAARTLALYKLGRYQAEGYDVRATTDTQVYGGILAEDPRTIAAVDATRGEVLVYQGRPILAVFHSDSGGMTESSEFVWGGRYPYLRGVPDPFTAAAPWQVRMDLLTFESHLRRAGRAVAGLQRIAVEDVTPSGRAGTVRLSAQTGTVALRATELRSLLGVTVLRSTLFTVRLLAEEQAVEFAGRGSGHGVGMSQWGARGLALQGLGYVDILRHYYAGVSLESR
jgi:stage II sporulation protein D